MFVIAVILLGLILMCLMGIINALQCPECKKLFALQWQPAHQSDKCKYCGHVVKAEDFIPPKVSYLKFLNDISPISKKK